MSQSDMILAYMREHGSITPLEALEKIGCMRLGARIYELKRSGHEIHSERVRRLNKHGETKNFAKYTLEVNG